ncbi:MAG: hypothetical protein VYA78_01065, partial [Chloroflexota bacterium]|nr:hypothetical protein [Chloroflexota bacterium]
MPVAEFHLLENEEDLARRLDDYVKAEVLALDIETSGLDPLTAQIRLVQIAAQGLPVLMVDLFKCRHGLSALTPLLVNESVKVIHNAKFELKFLLQNGIEIQGQIFDTMLADKLLQAGIGGHSSKLGHLAEFYLKHPLDKEEQNSDWSGDLTPSQLSYAARDVEILLPLRQKLIQSLSTQKLVEVAELEFDCVRTVAQMELFGLGLDVRKWQEYGRLIEEKIADYKGRLEQHF